jgi:hypothetical protein
MPTIEDYFRSFATTGAIGAKTLSRAVDVAGYTPSQEEQLFKKIVELLNPPAGGEFKSVEEIFKEMQILAGAKISSADSKAQIAKLMRLYTYSHKDPDSPLSTSIANFYKDIRPSAYTALDANSNVVGSGFDTTAFKQMIVGVGGQANPSEGSAKLPTIGSLTFLLIDTPSIDMKYRSADKVEAFMNYMPSFIASQLTPYLDVEFTFTRSSVSDERRHDGMNPLRFLLGSAEVDPRRTADVAMYDATVRKSPNAAISEADLRSGQEIVSAAVTARARGADVAADAKNIVVGVTDPKTGKKTNVSQKEKARQEAAAQETTNALKDVKFVPQQSSTMSTGMELFTMPQTLVNFDTSQDYSSRYNPVINPSLPFGVITNLTVDVKTNVGMPGGFKTANLSLKIFDRSRLIEIADFISPKLSRSVTIWLTYGWRAPVYPQASMPGAASDVKTYYDFINENMLKREAYSVMNSSVNIEKDGTVTITLQLFTRGAMEVVSSKDAFSHAYEQRLQVYENDLAEMRMIARRLGLQSVADYAADVRGSTIITSALAGNIATIDSKSLDAEVRALEKLIGSKNFGDDGSRFVEIVKKFYTQTGGSSTNGRDAALKFESRGAAAARFIGLKDPRAVDVFMSPMLGNDNKKYEKDLLEPKISPLSKVRDWNSKDKIKTRTAVSVQEVAERSYGEFGAVTFGKLFAQYFGAVSRNLVEGATVQEVQVVFYNLNSQAGNVAGINIAEFPMEMASVEEAYARRIAEARGENMTFSMLIEIVRESQFSNIQHPAYGFRDLYMPDKDGKLVVKDQRSSDELSNRIAQNFGNGGTFKQPVIEFYIETGYTGLPPEYRSTDLLNQYELAAGAVVNSEIASLRKILRIHIYDKNAIPSPVVSKILNNPGGYTKMSITELVESLKTNNKYTIKELEEITKKITSAGENIEQVKAALSEAIGNDPSAVSKVEGFFEQLNFKADSGVSSFDKVKEAISAVVPTITLGTNASSIESLTFSTQQDALMSTIFMQRNSKGMSNPTMPNGNGAGDLPLRVVPGALSMTSLGCPALEYMQQFFVDLGTGTTIDNLYNVTGLTHTITPGKFTTQVKFSFADAYGQYEEAQSFSEGIAQQLRIFTKELEDKEKKDNADKKAPAKPQKASK